MEFIQPLILLVIGIGLIAISLRLFHKHQKLKKIGLRTEGIVFDLLDSVSSDNRHQYPVIRFVTSKNEWITQNYEIGFSLKGFRKGQKVNVIYNPSRPEDFTVNSGVNSVILYTLIVIGIVLTGVAAFEVIQSI